MLLPVNGAQAQTCSCGVCPSEGVPFPGLERVFEDARIFVRLDRFDPLTVALVDPEGVPVAFSLEPAGDSNGTAHWITPAAPLRPGMHTLSAMSRGGGASWETEFTVLTGTSNVPPTLASVSILADTGTPYCEPLAGVALEWRAASGSGPLVLEVEVWRDGVLLGRAFPAWNTVNTETELGSSAASECFGSATVPGIEPGDRLLLRARLWDTSGHGSNVIEVPATAGPARVAPDCTRTCAASAGAPRGAGWLSAIPILGVLGLASRRFRP